MKKVSLLGYARKNTKRYILALSMIVLSTVSRVIAPTLLSRIVDEVIGERNYSVFPPLLLAMALFYALPGIVGYIQEVTSDSISRSVCCALRHDVLSPSPSRTARSLPSALLPTS